MLRSALPLSHLVLALAVLAPLAGFAQAPEEGASAPPLVPATETPSPPVPRGEVFPREQADEDLHPLFLVPRLVLQPPAGFLLGGVSGVVSLIPLLLITTPWCHGNIIDGVPDGPCSSFFQAGVSTIAAFGATVGVTAVGKLLYGRGRFWHTALGALVGTATGFLFALAYDMDNPFRTATVLAGSALGATVAFAISDAYAPESKSPARAGTGVSILPVVSATRTGGLIGGLVGRF